MIVPEVAPVICNDFVESDIAVALSSEGVVREGEFDNTTEPEPVEVVVPVPPLATGRAVPDSVMASVPEVVMGDPETDKKDGTEAATYVTVPPEPFGVQIKGRPSP